MIPWILNISKMKYSVLKQPYTKLNFNEIELSFVKGVSKPLELYKIKKRDY